MNDNDRLDRLLRDDARNELRDDGFSARVLGALPPRATPAFPWLKPLLVMGSAGLGAVLAATFGPGSGSLAQGFIDLAQARLTPAAVTGLAMGAALLLSAIVLAADAD
jgi:hypothetical protein